MHTPSSLHQSCSEEDRPWAYINTYFSPVPYGNQGCGGGARSLAILYIVDNGGLDNEKSYPYIAKVITVLHRRIVCIHTRRLSTITPSFREHNFSRVASIQGSL